MLQGLIVIGGFVLIGLAGYGFWQGSKLKPHDHIPPSKGPIFPWGSSPISSSASAHLRRRRKAAKDEQQKRTGPVLRKIRMRLAGKPTTPPG